LSIYFSIIDEKFTNEAIINLTINWRKNHQFYASSTCAMMASKLIMPKTLKAREKEK
jgi:hypothetical protein